VKNGRQMRDLADLGSRDLAGVFIAGDDAHVVLLRLDLDREDRYQVAYHEYVHLLVHRTFGSLPLWLNEGLAELYSHARLDTDKVLLGMPANYHLMALQEFSLMPVANLLTVDADSAYYTEDNRATIFYAQSWALTHYLLMGDRASHRPKLAAFLEALDEGASAADAAKKAFGDPELLNRTLRDYVSRRQFAALSDTVPVDNLKKDMTARPLPHVEALAMQATIAAVLGKQERAASLAEAAFKAAPDSPHAWMARARAARLTGDPLAVTAAFAGAVGRGSDDPLVHYGWAQISFAQNPQQPQHDALIAALERALALNPDLARASALLGYLKASKARDPQQGFSLVKRAIELEPGNVRHYLMLAGLLAQQQDKAALRVVMDRAARTTRTPEERAAVATVRQQLKVDE
jgi:tetratricopeptide (TPR) repeat protein